MRLIKTVAQLQSEADRERAAGRRIALVPTMGALHEGHLSLIDEGRRRADRVFLTIFVNPTQFNDTRDLDQYPRALDADLDRCKQRGVDVVFAPGADEMYPAGSQTSIEVTQLTRPLCGRNRPGHFRGVTTIVAKLLLAAKPHVAVFGEKDAQQLAVVRRMVADLGFDVEIVGAPIVRESDGLAMSSRNVNLHPEARRQATVLVAALDAAGAAVDAGQRDSREILHRVTTEIARAPLATVDYAELRDPDTLEPSPEELDGPALLALAISFAAPAGEGGKTVRLIDNRVLRPPTHDTVT